MKVNVNKFNLFQIAIHYVYIYFIKNSYFDPACRL